MTVTSQYMQTDEDEADFIKPYVKKPKFIKKADRKVCEPSIIQRSP